VFDLCHIDTTDGLLPAIIKAKGKPAPAYFVPKGVMSRKLNDETAERAAAEKEWAEEKKRSDAKIEELNKKVAELQSTVNEMIAKRDGAQKLGMTVIGGTSILPVLTECNQVLTNKVVELKSTLSEVKPKQGKEGKAHNRGIQGSRFCRVLRGKEGRNRDVCSRVPCNAHEELGRARLEAYSALGLPCRAVGREERGRRYFDARLSARTRCGLSAFEALRPT
jgi:hypothetical protein